MRLLATNNYIHLKLFGGKFLGRESLEQRITWRPVYTWRRVSNHGSEHMSCIRRYWNVKPINKRKIKQRNYWSLIIGEY